MKFEPGKSGNPRGRPKGSYRGRTRALMALDKMIGNKKSEAKMIRAPEKYLDDKPLEFFKTIVMPLLPKEAKVDVEHDGIVEWKSLVEAFPKVGPKGPKEG